MNKPFALTSEQLRALMAATSSVPRQHKDWFIHTISAELPFSYGLPEAINRALTRLQMREAAE